MSTPPATPPPARPRPPRRKGPSPITVITGTLGLFFVVLTLLAFQVRAGKDPSLSKTPAATSATAGGGASSPAATATRKLVTKTS